MPDNKPADEEESSPIAESTNESDDGQPEFLTRYLARLRDARARLPESISEMTGVIRCIADERVQLESEIDDMIAAVNNMGRRRHNSVSVSWSLPSEGVGNPLGAPYGPEWSVIRIARNGRRHRSRIKRLTVERCKESMQGRKSGELMRLYHAIQAKAERRNKINECLTKIRWALRPLASKPKGDSDAS